MICDIAVIGGGPGGTTAAFETARRGLKTVLVEMGHLGGTCLNCGCIPTKMLIGSTACLDLLAAQKKYKTASGEVTFTLTALQDRKNRYVKGTRDALAKRLADAGITVVKGRAAFNGSKSLSVKTENGTEEITYRHCIVAAGSTPAFFPGIRPDGESILSSTSLLNVDAAPKSLLIVGGGFIGLELGDIFHRLGTKITLVEALPRIASLEDEEISAALAKHHQQSGWTILTGRRVESLATENGESVLRLEGGEVLRAEKSLVAVGRQFPTAQLQCAESSIDLEKRGNICTDEYLRAGDGIYAVGDVNGKVLLAHAAEHQAHYAAAHIAGETDEPYSYAAMPSCIYGHMEVMRAGPTATELKQAGHAVHISRSQLITNAISQSYGASQGFVKVAWVDGTIRSITAFGHGVSHLVTLAEVAVVNGWEKNDINKVIFAHPTLDEALKSAILSTQTLLE